jgi:hypothetical protein
LQHLGLDVTGALDESDDIVCHGSVDLLGQLDVIVLKSLCVCHVLCLTLPTLKNTYTSHAQLA